MHSFVRFTSVNKPVPIFLHWLAKSFLHPFRPLESTVWHVIWKMEIPFAHYPYEILHLLEISERHVNHPVVVGFRYV